MTKTSGATAFDAISDRNDHLMARVMLTLALGKISSGGSRAREHQGRHRGGPVFRHANVSSVSCPIFSVGCCGSAARRRVVNEGRCPAQLRAAFTSIATVSICSGFIAKPLGT